jgi:GntR family transcriptional repressor for pyruvate dehydrogenase complex
MSWSDSWTAGQPEFTRLSASEAVLADLRAAIEKGELEVGAKLPSEAAMAGRYGVSRSVVREALRSCETLGLTKTHTGRGTFVIADRVASDLTMGGYSSRDLVEARPYIEVPAAGLAAERRTAEQCTELQRLIDVMAKTREPTALASLDADFHAAVAQASGNELFVAVLAQIRGALARQSETLTVIARRRDDSNREHQAIVDAIADGAVQRAKAMMASHLDAVSASVSGLMQASPRPADEESR